MTARDDNLLLLDLAIRGFRGIDELTIPRLGRVTLLAGRNGIGKTTVLEAIRVYASRGRPSEIADVLETREEDNLKYNSPDWTALFYGRTPVVGSYAMIGPFEDPEHLIIQGVLLEDDEIIDDESDYIPEEPIQAIRVEFNGSDILKWALSHEDRRKLRRVAQELPAQITCHSLGPGLLKGFELAEHWDAVTLGPDEDRAIESLNIIEGYNVSRVAMIGENGLSPSRSISRTLQGRVRRASRIPVVKLKDSKHRVPLRSLGDGAVRIFSTALALANGQDGFVLIDEVENGIHHSIQTDFWRMILQTAHKNNVQVVATTHSWDCVKGFAQASKDYEEAEGILVRLSRRHGPLRAVEYLENDLMTVAENNTEVR